MEGTPLPFLPFNQWKLSVMGCRLDVSSPGTLNNRQSSSVWCIASLIQEKRSHLLPGVVLKDAAALSAIKSMETVLYEAQVSCDLEDPE